LSQTRQTPLYSKHRQIGAKIVDFNGWLLPVEYSGITEEVRATRQSAALFDASHMGELLITGDNATLFLQKMLTNDLKRVKPGQALYSPLCQEDGGTLDDLLVYCLSDQRYLLVVNAANTARDLEWLQQYCGGGTEVDDVSDDYALLALQGPKSQALLQELTSSPLHELKYFCFLSEVEIAGTICLLSRTGYTGEDGFELFCSPEDVPSLWEALWKVGDKEDYGLVAAGLGARDLLRLEAALPLYGHELSTEITPLEAGLHPFVALNKEPAFVGQEAMRKQKETGLSRKLAGLELLKRGMPRQGYTVTAGGEEIGWVSSGSFSPTLNKPVALAFLPPAKTESGTEVEVVIRGREYPSRVIKTPFYRRG